MNGPDYHQPNQVDRPVPGKSRPYMKQVATSFQAFREQGSLDKRTYPRIPEESELPSTKKDLERTLSFVDQYVSSEQYRVQFDFSSLCLFRHYHSRIQPKQRRRPRRR
jgi:hypothetical protein